jgi:hypothetical protein
MDVIQAPFEEIPFSLIQGICTESLFLSPAECADAARQAPIHPALANTGG